MIISSFLWQNLYQNILWSNSGSKMHEKRKGVIFMGRHGENIRKRKDGRWEGRYLIYCNMKQKQVYHSVYGRSYNEVREKLTTQKNSMKNHSQTINLQTNDENKLMSDDILLLEVAKEWILEVKTKRKLSTFVKYDFILRNYIEKNFAGAALSEITSIFVKDNLPNHLSDSIQKSIYCVLNQILKFAFKHYSIIIPKLQSPVLDVRRKPIKALSRKEQKELIFVLYTEMDIYKLAVLTCLFTGLRLGELCALKWSDIDLDNQILTVKRTVQRLYVEDSKTKTVLMEMTPKSEYSRREVPLTETIFDLLTKFQSNGEYIFGRDKPLEPRTLQNHFKEMLKEAKLENNNFHILRHTFSTNCIEGGIDVKSLSEMLGHSDVQITLNRYVHPSMNTKRKYMDDLSRLYGQIYGQVG